MTYEDFLPYVAPSVNACPTIVAIHNIRQAAIEFCEKTQVWRERMDTMLGDGISTRYTLPIDDQTEVSKLLEVTVGITGQVADRYDIVKPIDGRDAQRLQTSDRIAWTDNRSNINLHPIPAVDAEIDVYVALKPSLASFLFPDELFRHHAEHIAAGALARLFKIPKTDWYDVALAVDKRNEFMNAISTQAVTAHLGNGRSRRRQTTRWF